MGGLLKLLNMMYFKKLFAIFLGVLECVFTLLFLVFTIPVYVFREVVIILAKHFRPELGDILGGQSAILVNDYMTQNIPRSNVVHVMVFEGELTLEELRRRVLKRWIVNNKSLENFRRYPVKWLGFTFWKDASCTFSIENHIFQHSGKDTQVSDQQLVEITETMLNTKLPKCQSPWEMHLVENYEYPHSDTKSRPRDQIHSALILKYHHCLMDGVGMMTAIMDGLFEQPWKRQSETTRPKPSLRQKLLFNLTFPLKAFAATCYIFSHTFWHDFFKIPDERKDWHQIIVKSSPIPIQVIKNIKNTFGVSYTSVLLSAMSAAAHEVLSKIASPPKNKSTLCLSVLPPIGIVKRKVLANHMTGAIFNLPTVRYESSIDRLQAVNRLFEDTRRSVIPILGQYYTNLVGAHSYLFNRFLTKNRMIPIGLTNFACVQDNIVISENLKWVDSWVFAGGHVGVAGLGVMVVSHGQKVSFHVCAENALMLKVQSEEFLCSIIKEIGLLQNLTL